MKPTFTLIAALLLAPLAALAQERQTPSWTTSPVRAPRVEFRTFPSQAAKATVSFHVFTPEIYDREKEKRFPVLYWLHGSGGGEKGVTPLSAFFDRAIREGKIPPMLVVFPHGMAASMWCDSKDGAVPMETVVTRELVPHIDATFRTLATREARMIEGFSMGGYGAARLGLKYPQLFGAVSILAGGPLDLDFAGPRAAGNPAERERILNSTFGGDLDYYRAIHPITVAEQQVDAVRGKIRVRIVAGARDNTGPLNRTYSDHLKKLNIAHTFTIVPRVGHETLPLLTALGEENWQFYRSSLGSSSPPATPISHRLLVTDYGANRVCIVSASGEIEWEYPATTPQDCWLLANGNVLFSQSTGAVEVTREKKVVWQYIAPPQAKVHSCQPLPDGSVLVAECFMSRLVIVGRDGRVAKVLPVKSTPKVMSHQFRGVRCSADGHFWICLMDEKKVVELDAEGAQLREIPLDGHPGGLVKLPNGHLLISVWDKTEIIELDANLKPVWRIGENELPGNPLRIPMGIHRLANGNTVFGNYIGHGFTGKQPMLFEVTPDKKVVWEFADHTRFKTVCQVQIIDTPADPLKGEVLR
jgi:S-formylglutathione hydrolase FrmB|uniref:alpha/beta hydrolase-fold protein n=1 Tax=Prosthecobacter sp. TaxID=1965333 RepID=UPI0037847795